MWFNNSGKTIQTIGKIVCLIGGVVAVLTGVKLITVGQFWGAFFVLLVAPPLSFFSCLVIHAFGEIVENSFVTAYYTKELYELELKKQERKNDK